VSVDKGIPGITAVIDDIVAGFEDSVREPVDARILRDIFDGFIAAVLQAGQIKAAPFPYFERMAPKMKVEALR
jgi:hypothetical protein